MGKNKYLTCQSCEKEIRSDKLTKHFLFCIKKSFDFKCPLCLKILSKTNISKHLKICKNNPERKTFLEIKNYGKFKCLCNRFVDEIEFFKCLEKNHKEDYKFETRSEEKKKIELIQKQLEKGESKIHYVHPQYFEEAENSFEIVLNKIKNKDIDL